MSWHTTDNCVDNAGGALSANANNTLTLSENTFQDNSANIKGGALFVYTLTLLENTFLKNFADSIGGVLFVHTNNILTLSRNTFWDKSALRQHISEKLC